MKTNKYTCTVELIIQNINNCELSKTRSERITDKTPTPVKYLACLISEPICDSKYCCVKLVLTEKLIDNDLQPMKEQDTGQQEVREGVI